MLAALRSGAKSWVAKILFVLLILSFGVWGVGDMVRVGVSNAPAIVAGDVEVSAEAVVTDYRREVSRLQRNFGSQFTEEQARQMGLLQSTIRQMAGQALLEQATRDLDMLVTDDALMQVLSSNPVFRNDVGQFDRFRLRQVISQAGFGSEEEFLALMRLDIARSQLVTAVSEGVTVPDTLVDTLFAHRGEKRVAELLRFPAEAVPAPEAADEAALKAYHEAHSGDFMAPEFRKVTALVLRPEAVSEQIAVTDEELQEAYAQRAGEYVEPERRSLTQIVFAEEDKAKQAAALAAEGTAFAALAEQTGEPVVELGAMDRDTVAGLSPDLAEAVFAPAEPGLVGPVKSPFGWHVVKVGDIRPRQEKPLAEVRDQLREAVVRERAIDRLYELANTVDDTLASGATIEEAAGKLDVPLLRFDAVDPQGRDAAGAAIAGLPAAPFLQKVFQTQEGSDTMMVELEDNAGFFIARVDKVTAPAVQPFETVRDQVLAAWSAEQKQIAAKARAEQALAQLKDGKPLAEVAQAFGATPQATQPFTRSPAQTAEVTPQIASAVFGLAQPGEAAMVETGDGAAVAVLQKVIPADAQADKALKDQLTAQLTRAMTGDVVDVFLAALQDKHGVSINNRVIDERLQ